MESESSSGWKFGEKIRLIYGSSAVRGIRTQQEEPAESHLFTGFVE